MLCERGGEERDSGFGLPDPGQNNGNRETDRHFVLYGYFVLEKKAERSQ